MEMDVSFVDEQGVETKKTMIANYMGEEDNEPLTRNISLSCKPKNRTFHNPRTPHHVEVVSILMNMGGEFLGTFVLTLVICSVVSSSILSSAQVGIWQVAIICGLGVSVSIYCTSHICDAHLNPAITVAFAIFRFRIFSWKKIVPYILSQVLGGVAAGAVLYFFSNKQISLYEERNEIDRGDNTSVLTAMMFGEYFPNPALYSHTDPDNLQVVSVFKAFAVEAWTTAILAFVIFCCTDDTNSTVGRRDNKVLVPLLIGLTVAIMISIYGPLTQVGMNPARDFGPRLVSLCAGWGKVAIPGPRAGFWVYILGPILGALAGALLNDLIVFRVVKTVKIWRNNSDSESDCRNTNTDRHSSIEMTNL